MRVRFFFLSFFLLTGFFPVSFGQSAPDSLEVSLITSGPGADLYTAFGHSALRVQDFTTGDDYVFNYGTFDFSTPHFYWKFARGKLLYFLSVSGFKDFLQEYKSEGRDLEEQVLNLDNAEKQKIYSALVNNYRPENRAYQYDFLFDNCATRIRDIVGGTFDGKWMIGQIVPREGLTFRQIINDYLKDSPWERVGINILFGWRSDRAMTNQEIMFLPDYLMKGFALSSVSGKPLVKKTIKLNEPSPGNEFSYPFYKKPWFGFALLGLAVVILSFVREGPAVEHLLGWIDRCLFFLTGMLGFFLLFMWFGTDHDITKWNLNILWLFPFNLIFSFFFFRNKKWVRNYAIFLLTLNIVLLAAWFVLPQQLPFIALPVIAALSSRAWKIARRVKVFS